MNYFLDEIFMILVIYRNHLLTMHAPLLIIPKPHSLIFFIRPPIMLVKQNQQIQHPLNLK